MPARLLLCSTWIIAGAALTGFTALPDTRFHLRLVRAEPAADSTVTQAPERLKLWFSQPVELKVTSVKLTDASGQAAELGGLAGGGSRTEPVVAPVADTLAAGRYTVAWRTMARDGHVVKGEFAFTLAERAAAR